MNDVGLTLAWLAVQIAILLAPALILHGLASRRGPAPGAWVAGLSLGLVVILNVAAFVPRIAWNPSKKADEVTPVGWCDEMGPHRQRSRPARSVLATALMSRRDEA